MKLTIVNYTLIKSWLWCDTYNSPMQRHNSAGIESFTAWLKDPCTGPHYELYVSDNEVEKE